MGEGVVEIGKLNVDREKCESYAIEFANLHYDFNNKKVLFKPTKAQLNNLDLQMKGPYPISLVVMIIFRKIRVLHCNHGLMSVLKMKPLF